jgi:FtsH-binding integral membrane protein
MPTETPPPYDYAPSVHHEPSGGTYHFTSPTQTSTTGLLDGSNLYADIKVVDAEQDVRLAFVRRVYGLLSIQLFVTFIMSVIMYSVSSVNLFVRSSPGLTIVISLVSLIAVIAIHFNRRKHPHNLILLGIFTLIMGYMVGASVIQYDLVIVLEAALTTVIVFGSLTAYTLLSKRDFSGMGPFLFAGLVGLIAASLIQIIVAFAFGAFNPWVDFGLSLLGTFIFSGYIIFDTYMIFNRMSPEDYVPATLELYLDIINLFLHLLRIFAKLQGNRH